VDKEDMAAAELDRNMAVVTVALVAVANRDMIAVAAPSVVVAVAVERVALALKV
jgi:hypothetical protein